MESPSRGRILLVPLFSCLLVCGLVATGETQGIRQSPYSAADALRRGPAVGGLDLAPSNPLGLPGSTSGLLRGSNSLYVSDSMLRDILPLIPNLQFGYLYDFGNNRVSSGRFTADYLLPFNLSADSTMFGEAHAEFQDFWKTESFNSRVDMSFGGGFRTFLGRDTLLGVNGFYDTSRLGSTWYSSGSVGLEMAALMGSDALDLNFNWYGQLFNGNVIRNAFRYGPSNFDFQVGYSHELWNGGPDLRLSATGYKFDLGTSVYGWDAGAELKSRDGMFVLKYDVGHDRVNETYQQVGGFVNVGFQLENIFRGETPFTMPEPIFRSPRSLRHLLTQKVKRDWHQPTAIVVTRQGRGGCSNLDRFLASVAMQSAISGWYSSDIVAFSPVPYTCLDPAKYIVVEFDYAFDAPPTAVAWSAAVANASLTAINRYENPEATSQSGHVVFTLNSSGGSPAASQAAFTTTASDPAVIGISAYAYLGGTTTLAITNVTIHFNQ